MSRLSKTSDCLPARAPSYRLDKVAKDWSSGRDDHDGDPTGDDSLSRQSRYDGIGSEQHNGWLNVESSEY
jgi:hypothetical protein